MDARRQCAAQSDIANQDLKNQSETESKIANNLARQSHEKVWMQDVNAQHEVDEWNPLVNYAPESLDTNLDRPADVIHQQFFNFFVSEEELQSMMEDIMIAHKVIKSGIPNRWGCRIPVRSGWNIEKLNELLADYHHKEVVQWLQFGFPVSWDEDKKYPMLANTNHLGATLFQQYVDKYFEKEIRLGASIGPFRIPPFVDRIGISPISTRPKRDSDVR